MVAPARTPQAGMLTERLLIMRLITSIALALLLMLGIAASGHAEGDGEGGIPLITAVMDPHVDSAASDAAPGAVMESSPANRLLGGVALCVLGVLCGLVAFLLARAIRLRRLFSVLTRAPRPPVRPLALITLPRATTPTLPELGLSRT
ncbi:hypothetical protein ACWKWN_03420 [Microbacterium trichothecenolyticum]